MGTKWIPYFACSLCNGPFPSEQRLPAAFRPFHHAVLLNLNRLYLLHCSLIDSNWKETVKATFYAIFLFIAITLPFALQAGSLWIFKALPGDVRIVSVCYI